MDLLASLVWNEVHRLKAGCRGEARVLSFQRSLAAVSQRREQKATTTLRTWEPTSKKSFGRRVKMCGEVGWSGQLEIFAESQAYSWKQEKELSISPSYFFLA